MFNKIHCTSGVKHELLENFKNSVGLQIGAFISDNFVLKEILTYNTFMKYRASIYDPRTAPNRLVVLHWSLRTPNLYLFLLYDSNESNHAFLKKAIYGKYLGYSSK